MGDRRIDQLTRQGEQSELRGINGQEGTRFFHAVKQSFEQCPHGIEAVVIEQCPHAFPQQALAAQFGPDGSEQGAAQLLGLVDQKRQHHHDRKHH